MRKYIFPLLILMLHFGLLQAEQTTSVTYLAFEQAKQPYAKPVHYIGLGAKLGYSQFSQSFAKDASVGIGTLNSKLNVPGGFNGGLEFRYKMEYNLLRFTVGLDAVYAGNSFSGLVDYEYPVVEPTTDMTYHYNFHHISESQHTFEVGLPVMVGANYRGFYVQAGMRLGLPLMKSYGFKTQLTTVIHDEKGIDDYTDMANHFLYDRTLTNKGQLRLSAFNPQVAVELGYNLDPYMQQPFVWKPGQKPSFLQLLHYEVALYANVGVMNYKAAPQNDEFFTRKSPVDPEIESVGTLTDDRTLASGSLLPWNVGVRFNVYYELYDKPAEKKARKRRPRKPKPKVEEVVVDTVVETIVYNEDTIQKGDTIIMENLYFDTDKSTIRRISDDAINELAATLQARPTMKITLVGHTDNVGKVAYNQRLSEARVESVKNELIKRGIDGDRIKTVGKGMSEPIADNKTAEGRAQNRRVEIIVDEL